MIDRDTVLALRYALAANPALCDAASPGRPVDIIVPVYNAVAHTVACLESVARKTRDPFRLIVINDGSSDADVASLLDGIRGAAPNLITIDRPRNVGFVRTVNEGFALSPTNDVVVLNSDTQVTENWLGKLRRAAESRPDVATVTPLTNNGTICSIPDPFQGNALPEGYDLDTFAALVDATAPRSYPEAPTGVGFCMLITRKALDRVGVFDAEAFPRGYGEENDFCQRAIRRGLVNLIADDAFVFHEGGASFGTLTSTLLDQNLRVVAGRYPDYLRDVERFYGAHPLAAYHEYLRQCIAVRRTGAERIDIRVLHVLHEGGGTEKHARDLAALDDPGVLSYLLLSDGQRLSLEECYRGHVLRTMRFPLPSPLARSGAEREPEYGEVIATICWALEINLIHVHHLIHHALDLAEVAARRGLPYVMTLHDYYTLCPTYTLLDPDGQLCRDCPTPTVGRSAEACMRRIGKPGAHLLDYQARMHEFLRGARVLFVPNVSVKEVFCSRFADLAPSVMVVEHGSPRPLNTVRAGGPDTLHGASPPSLLDVAVIGGLEAHKGLAVFRNLLRANRSRKIRFHLYGTTPDARLTRMEPDRETDVDGSRYVYHGPYASTEIVDRLIADGIQVGLQPSIWPETFSYTLSEFVEAGIPVIAGDLGAQGERVRRCHLGWTVPDIADAEAVLRILDAIAADPRCLGGIRAGMDRDAGLPALDAMWNVYLSVYRAETSKTITDDGHEMSKEGDAPPSKSYVAYLAMQMADLSARTQRAGPSGEPETPGSMRRGSDAELRWLRERLRSPRHRMADALANSLQRVPVVWPIVARLTEAALRWEVRRRRSGRDRGRPLS